jgi:hypothetical protein
MRSPAIERHIEMKVGPWCKCRLPKGIKETRQRAMRELLVVLTCGLCTRMIEPAFPVLQTIREAQAKRGKS